MILHSLKKYSDAGLAALRISVAAVFLYHGFTKFGLWSAAPTGMDGGMVALMKALSIIEPIVALLVLIGFFTRLSAMILGLIMIGAIYMKITAFKVGYGGGWELDANILAENIALLTLGAGAWSVDALLGKKK